MTERRQLMNVLVAPSLLLAALACSCSGDIGPSAPDGNEGEGGSGGAPGGRGGSSKGQIEVCMAEAESEPTPVLRLTAKQYNNTLRELFAGYGVSITAQTLIDETNKAGFDNNSFRQSASSLLVERYAAAAQNVATAAVAQLDKLVGCKYATAAEGAACGKSFIAGFGKRAFRRPLLDEETSRFEAFFTKALADYGFEQAMALLLRGFLQAPAFVYRLELSDVDEALTDHEMASRLSYLLWNSMPDADLRGAAEAGKLHNSKDIAQQVERMLAHPLTRAAVADFHRQWLHLDDLEKLKGADKDAKLYPQWSEAVAQDMRESTRRFVDWAFWDSDGRIETLLTAPKAFVNARLAPIYGVSASSEEFSLTDLNPSQRAGLLTQAGWLASTAHARISSPILRGVFVLDRLLCAPTPGAPPDVNAAAVDAAPGAGPQTTRQKFETDHTGQSCRGCHNIIDPVGFALENFDAIGSYRTQESGMDVDASGHIDNIGDVDGTFRGGVELAKKLAPSAQVRNCVTRQWLALALARDITDSDECVVEAVMNKMAEGGSMKDLVAAIATSPAFRSRPLQRP